MPHDIIIPPSLSAGSKIAILSPATIVNPDYIDGAERLLSDEGFSPLVMPHAKGPASGSFAASDADRLSDLLDAWSNPEINAIFCARGGYGCNHLIDKIPLSLVRENPKWLIGFSDISALHALSLRAGVASLHSPMAKHLTELGVADPATIRLLQILRSGPHGLEYSTQSHPLSIPGVAEGRLVGGNLAVINGLAATPFDPIARADSEDTILFIEDISEAIYAAERMLIRLRLAGHLQKMKGIVAGQFTEYRPDRNYQDMEHMIAAVTEGLGIPVAMGFPAGHVDLNFPLPLGCKARLSVSPHSTSLSFLP